MTHDISISINNVIQGGLFISKKQQNRFNSQLILWPLGPFGPQEEEEDPSKDAQSSKVVKETWILLKLYIYIYFFLGGGCQNPVIVGSGQYIVCLFFMKGTRF